MFGAVAHVGTPPLVRGTVGGWTDACVCVTMAVVPWAWSPQILYSAKDLLALVLFGTDGAWSRGVLASRRVPCGWLHDSS